MNTRQALGVAAAVVIVWSTGASASTFAHNHVAVRLYDRVGLRPPVLHRVLAGVPEAFGRAGVTVSWVDCSTAAAAATCAAPLGAGELAVRVVALPLPAGHAGNVPLADALIDRHLRSGVLATIYFDRVEMLAHAAGADVGVLLAHTIEHEIAHLLAGTNHHDGKGLMRPVWTVNDVRRNRPDSWEFEN